MHVNFPLKQEAFMEQIRQWRALRQVTVLMLVAFGILSFAPRVDAAYVSNFDLLSSQAGERDADMDTIQNTLENKMVVERLEAHAGLRFDVV